MSEVEVGRITVKVSPDTRGFRKKLEKGVKKESKGVKAPIGNDFDDKGLKSDVQKAAKKAATDVKITPVLDDKKLKKAASNLSNAWQKAKAAGNAASNKRILAQDKLLNDQLEKINKAHIQAINEDRARSLDKVKMDVKARAETAEADAKLAAFLARQRAKFAKDLELKVKTNRSAFRQFNKLSNVIDDVNSGIQLSARSWAILAAVLLLAAPAVALVGSLLVAIPSALAVVAAPIGAVALGMEGIKKAALALEPSLIALKASVSATFEKGLAPVMERVSKLLPQFESGFNHVANAVVGVADGVVGFFEGEEAMNQFNNVMERTKDLFRDIAPFFNDFLSGLMTLTSGGADNFRFLADAFNQFGEDWSGMANRLVHTGVMESAMKGLSTVTQSLLGNFLRLVEVGAGSMESMAGPIDTFLTGFVDLFVGLQPLLTTLSNMFFEVFGNLGTVLGPVFEKMAPGIQAVAEGFTELINSNISSLGPILEEISTNMSTALLEVMKEIGPMLPELTKLFGDLAVSLVKELGPMLPEIATSFGQLAAALLKISPAFLKSLTETLIPMIPKFAELAEKALALAPAFLAIAGAALSFAANLAAVIGTVVGFLGVLSPIGGAIMAATGGFEGSGEKIKEWARIVGVSIGEAVAKVAAGAVEMVAAISGMAGEFFSAGVAAVTGLINGIGSMIGAAVAKAKELAQSVINAAKGIGGFIINSPSKPFITMGEEVGEGLDKGLKNSIPGSEKAVKDLAQATLSAGKGEFANNTIYSQEDVQQLHQLREEYKELGKVLKDLNKQKEELGLKGDTEGQAAINNEIQMVKQRRKELNLQKKSVETQKDANSEADEAQKQQAKYINAAVGAGTDFALANANQFASDIGIGGQGAISQGVDQGISFLTSSISKLVSSGLGGTGGNIVVNNVDDAVAAKQNQTNVQKKRYANR